MYFIVYLYEIDLTFDLKCLLISRCRSVEPQGWSTNEIIRGTGTPEVRKWVSQLERLEAVFFSLQCYQFSIFKLPRTFLSLMGRAAA